MKRLYEAVCFWIESDALARRNLGLEPNDGSDGEPPFVSDGPTTHVEPPPYHYPPPVRDIPNRVGF